MANSALKSIPNQVTRTLVCVDRLENSDFAGMLYNPYFPQPTPFGQVKDIISIFEDFFNRISYPQPYFESRSFLNEGKPPEYTESMEIHRYTEDDIFERKSGRIATFEIEVRYRHSATWQGNYTWREKGFHGTFRSTLELILLMDSAVTESAET